MPTQFAQTIADYYRLEEPIGLLHLFVIYLFIYLLINPHQDDTIKA